MERLRECSVCGHTVDCRPYRDNMREICYECAAKPQYRDEVARNSESRMKLLLDLFGGELNRVQQYIATEGPA